MGLWMERPPKVRSPKQTQWALYLDSTSIVSTKLASVQYRPGECGVSMPYLTLITERITFPVHPRRSPSELWTWLVVQPEEV